MDEALQPGHRRPARPADVPALRRRTPKAQQIGQGHAASPGAAVGKAVFDSYTAVKWSRSGEKVILVRRETNPDDLDGMIAAEGILTCAAARPRTPPSSPAAWARPASAAPRSSRSTPSGRRFTAPGGTVVEEGDVISIDGSTGEVYLGEVPVVPSPVVRVLRGPDATPGPTTPTTWSRPCTGSWRTPTEKRRLRVRANADNAEDAARARRFGAAGHRPVPHRAHVPRRAPRARRAADPRRHATTSARQALDGAAAAAEARTSSSIFEAMDGLPVTVRLLDPPLHEFLPDLTELSVRVALAEAREEPTRTTCGCSRPCTGCTSRTRCWACAACGSAWSSPACSPCRCGRSPRPRPSARRPGATRAPEIMIPLVGAVQELEIVREEAEQVLAEVASGDRASSSTLPDRHDDRAAARRADRRADRRGRRVLLLRHQRPHPDDLGLLPRRRRGGVLLRLPGEGHLRGLPVRVARPATASAALVRIAVEEGRADPARPQARRLRRARRRPGLGALLPRGRPRLRLLLAVPGPGGPAGGRPRGHRRRRAATAGDRRVDPASASPPRRGCGRADACRRRAGWSPLGRVWWVARQDDRRASDAIVVLGAAQFDGRPSSVFTARLVHARDLYEDDVAPRIVTVGGNRAGDRFTEAAAGKRWLTEHGVPGQHAIVAVATGSDTLQQRARRAEEDAGAAAGRRRSSSPTRGTRCARGRWRATGHRRGDVADPAGTGGAHARDRVPLHRPRDRWPTSTTRCSSAAPTPVRTRYDGR